MRPASQRSYSSSSHKPDMQVKFKPRVNGQQNQGLMNLSIDGSKFQSDANRSGSTQFNLHSSRHNHQDCESREEVFYKTACKLTSANFSHHDPNVCVCEFCTCGRHLCKLHVIKPDLKKNTIYQRDYPGKKAIPNIVPHAEEYGKLKGPHLDMNSTYLEGFPGREGDKLERPRPEDLLKSGGPSPFLTSYSSGFPGHRGQNQYVKPTDKHYRADFPLRSKSTYSNEFVKKDPKKDDYTRIPDQLKTGSNWYGKTTYGSFFNGPNPQYFAKPVKVVQKLEQNPNFNHQYETTYKNDFLNRESTVCPAKIQLETISKGIFNSTKSNFNENTDFKSFSPNFQAISTSKHISP